MKSSALPNCWMQGLRVRILRNIVMVRFFRGIDPSQLFSDSAQVRFLWDTELMFEVVIDCIVVNVTDSMLAKLATATSATVMSSSWRPPTALPT